VAGILSGGLDAVAAATRAELAERRLEESEHRGRARVEELENRAAELRRKLDDALVQSESAMRVARVQGDEMDELRARLRRAAEDRLATDGEMTRLRRALSEADEAVLSLTRKTAEQMAVVAQQIATGFRASVAAAPSADAKGSELLSAVREELALVRAQLAEAVRSAGPADIEHGASMAVADAEERVRAAEQAVARERAEAVELGRRLQGAEEKIRGLSQRAALIGDRDARIARLEGDKQDLVWRVAELEEKHRHAVADATVQRPVTEDVQAARAGRDRAIAELHRAAAAHASEVNRLRASVDEQAALVVELEDSLRAAEARAGAADKDASTLRRNAKALEEADRTRRGRLAELEGKLLRLEREKSLAAAAGSGPGGGEAAGAGAGEESARRLGAMEQRALAAEQQVVGLEERLAAAERQVAAAAAAAAAAEARRTVPAVVAVSAEGLPSEPQPEPSVGARLQNGTHGLPDAAEIQAAIEDVEQQLRQELRMLTAIEDTLTRARDQVARSVSASLSSTPPASGERTDLERTIATKDAQLIETRLELSRLRRESEDRQAGLEREINDLRTRLAPQGGAGAGTGTDSSFGATGQSQSTQLIVMHTTLANIRRRAARLRDELEGFRRRLDSLPPGALSSLLEEIGEDLGEFAK
jgi:chromosome segregation ATPase